MVLRGQGRGGSGTRVRSMEVAAGGPAGGLEIPCCPFDDIEG